MLSNIKHNSLAGLAVLGASASPGPPTHSHIHGPASPSDLLHLVLENHPELSKFALCINKHASIAFSGIGNYMSTTLFAPTNAAFDTLRPDFDFDNATEVVPLLQYHLLQQEFLWADFPNTTRWVPTHLHNTSLTNVTGGQRAALIRQDENELVVTSGTKSRAILVKPPQPHDLRFFEGIIQPVDAFLRPPTSLVDTAATRPDLMASFMGALLKTGLAAEVLAASDVTIFAPTNAAFRNAYAALDVMSDDELRAVLLYHIVPGTVMYSGDLRGGLRYNTALATDEDSMEPHTVSLSHVANDRFVDSSRLIDSDNLIANGVVHIISNVLNPRKPDLRPNPAEQSQALAFDITAKVAGAAVPTPYVTDVPSCTSNCSTATAKSVPTRTAGVNRTASATRQPLKPQNAAVRPAAVLPGAVVLVGAVMVAGAL